MSDKVVIVDAKRSAIGRFGGALKKELAVDFTSQIAKEMLTGKVKPQDIEEVILGNVLQAGQGQGPARQVGLKANIPVEAPAFTVNQICGSGMTSIILGMQKILTGERSIVLVGGMESMSGAPYLNLEARFGAKLGNKSFVDTILRDALTDNLLNIHMGETAENIAEKYLISREEQDAFSLKSHQKAEEAWLNGRFSKEVIPIKTKLGGVFEEDEHYRKNMTVEQLQKLSSAFIKEGTVTAGNSSGINDGAALLILMSKSKAEALEIPYLAEIESVASCGVAPELMGLGPIASSRAAMEKANLSVESIDLFEINEAFAAQAIAVQKQLEIPSEKLNINGGAIALGHPVGCSGARIVVTLCHALINEKKTYGLASLCVGGGMGLTIIIKRKEES